VQNIPESCFHFRAVGTTAALLTFVFFVDPLGGIVYGLYIADNDNAWFILGMNHSVYEYVIVLYGFESPVMSKLPVLRARSWRDR
jgi:hypothetical protein